MICVYPAACTDFSGNGLGVVQPQSCTCLLYTSLLATAKSAWTAAGKSLEDFGKKCDAVGNPVTGEIAEENGLGRRLSLIHI